MKCVSVVLLLFCSLMGFGQASYIEPENPAPRVGETVGLTIHLKKQDLQQLEGKDNRSDEEDKLLFENEVASGNLKLTHIMTDTGLVSIGPFRFTIADKVYETAPIAIRVQPALSDDITDGIWLRLSEFGGYHYLIVEQRISNSWKRDSKDPNTISLGTSELKFAEFDREKFERLGLEIVSSSESTENQILNKTSAFGTGNVGYKMSRFKFKKTGIYLGNAKIDKSFFSQLPKGIFPKEVYIK